LNMNSLLLENMTFGLLQYHLKFIQIALMNHLAVFP
jgi:hypothetical protein